MGDRPVIDLSSGQYDELENKLSQYLGIKIMLVRGWKTPDSYISAEANVSFASVSHDQSRLDAARKTLESAKTALAESLRKNIAGRDPSLAETMTREELLSLQKVRHVTLRYSNADPEHAVLIFDPMDTEDGKERREELYWTMFGQSGFHNAWNNSSNHEEDSSWVKVDNFIESFDVSHEDWRAYTALMNVRYALTNQHEYNNLGKSWYYEPLFYAKLGLATDRPRIHGSTHDFPLEQNFKTAEFENTIPLRDVGINDEDFLEKLTIAGAVHDLGSPFSPVLTLTRLTAFKSKKLDAAGMNEIFQDINARMKAALKQHMTESAKDTENGYIFMPLGDCRILFPLFREVYEQDQSTGLKRQYLDVIMAGLQRYFPTLTNGPVPELDPEKEPPRTLAGYKALGNKLTPPQPPLPPGPG